MGTERKFLTIYELSEYLGRSPGAIRNLVMRKRIPYRKLAGRLIFLPEELEVWIDESKGAKVDEVVK
jgi:excisionase family DNA binding protein